MKKKTYEKPTMTVVELQYRTCLLQASGEQPPENVADYDDLLGFAPGISKDGNHSA